MRTVDLHTHSCCSDGEHAPQEVVRRAAAAGITHFALTDHDTTEGVAAAAEAAVQLQLLFLSGIELSTAGHARQHMLGYGIDPANAALTAACKTFTERRLARAEKIAQLLQSQGINVTMAEAQAEAKGQLGRPHFARVMVRKGYASSVLDAFARYLATPEVRAIPDPKPSAEEAIHLIHEAGGIAVLAHPITLGLEGDAFCEKLDALCALGLDGLEVYYPKHSPAQQAFYAHCAEKRGLCMTGGSDYHGESVKPDIPLGMTVPQWLTAQPRLAFR